MRTRIFTLITGAILLADNTHAQLQRIVLQGSGSPQVFTDINAALTAAQPNDKLYFSGGAFSSAATVIIDKPLHFIGAGIHPDSTSVTGVTTLTTSTGDIIITTPASGSTFTGISFDPSGSLEYGTSGADDDPVNIVFHRCSFLKVVGLGGGTPGASSSTLFDECLIYRYVTGGYYEGEAASFTRCVFANTSSGASVSSIDLLLTIDHCVFLNGQAVSGCTAAVVKNSAFTSADYPFYQSNNMQILNNMFHFTGDLTGNSSGEVMVDNLLGVPLTEFFVNETDGEYQFTDDLHLVPTSVGVGAADDGTDIGIYGTSSPYKPGAVTYNPHFRSADIAPATNPNGDLPVNIRVAAQPN
jgi:hypothetical protein